MKQFIAFLLIALMGINSAFACIRKNKEPKINENDDLVIFVMDTMQSLLPNAEIQLGKLTRNTSWDGRVVLTPEQWKNAKKITVKCDGFETYTMKRSEFENPLFIPMKPKKMKGGKKKEEGVMVRGTRLLYRSGTPEATEPKLLLMETSAVADFAVAEDVEMPKMMGGSAKNAAAGMLTAGEVNDFAKWSLWKTYHESAVNHQNTWQLYPTNRYTVLVKTEDGHPAVNYPVNLTDANDNTLFQAMTDNTGKAELWANLTTKDSLQNANALFIRVDEQRIKAKEWKDGINVFIIDEPCDAPEEVDVLFVFDATGSMGDELRYLQAEMRDVIARATDATRGLNIRTGAVVYRDHNDDYVTRISRLTKDITETQNFIDKQEAYGGGDYPEAVPEALMAGLNSAGWNPNARARIAFLILDAPCHSDSTTLALLHDQIRNAAAMGVRIVPVVCSGLSESGEFLVRAISLTTNGTSFFLTDDSGIGHEHLKPTTDSLVVEHLNDMLVRTIVEFCTMPNCQNDTIVDTMINDQMVNNFVPNPFETEDLQANPTLPHGEGVHYLVDMSGKLLGIFQGEINAAYLPKGVYLDKQFIDGKWHTKKFLVQ